MRDDRHRRQLLLMDQLAEIVDIGRGRVVAVGRPLAVAMAAQIGRQHMPVAAQRRRDPVPVAAMVAPAMHEQQRRRARDCPNRHNAAAAAARNRSARSVRSCRDRSYDLSAASESDAACRGKSSTSAGPRRGRNAAPGQRSSETPACGGRSRASGGGSFAKLELRAPALTAELFLGLFPRSPMPRESATGNFRVESCCVTHPPAELTTLEFGTLCHPVQGARRTLEKATMAVMHPIGARLAVLVAAVLVGSLAERRRQRRRSCISARPTTTARDSRRPSWKAVCSARAATGRFRRWSGCTAAAA